MRRPAVLVLLLPLVLTACPDSGTSAEPVPAPTVSTDPAETLGTDADAMGEGIGEGDTADGNMTDGDTTDGDMTDRDMGDGGMSGHTSGAGVLPDGPEAALALLPGAPQAQSGLGGRVVVSADRTTVGLDLTGLQPESSYMAHVHEQECARDAGGPHFRFDPAGSDQPPNEVHLVARTGAGETTATALARAAQPLPPRARSVVVHIGDDKIACAGLPAAP
jgi:hypothetical protein